MHCVVASAVAQHSCHILRLSCFCHLASFVNCECQKFRGRKRNCYRLSTRSVHKALMHGTIGRAVKKKSMAQLWNVRLEAATTELGLTSHDLREGLARNSIQIDRKVLTDLAIYEPRTFKSLVEIARGQLAVDGRTTYEKSYYPGYFNWLRRTSS